MATTNTAGKEVPDQPELLIQPAHEQLHLPGQSVSDQGVMAEPRIDELSSADANGRRMFVPSNRERIMLQLGALVLSPDFPPRAGIPMDATQAPLIIHDGLRSEEINVLADGRPQRFPVLAEVRSSACKDENAAFGILDVAALYFRNEGEAGDFRFRPVDELDTGHLPCIAEPSLFALDGASRLGNPAHVTAPESQRRAALADRIAGGISCLLELADANAACRQAVADLLSRQGSVPWLECLSRFFTAGAGTHEPGAHAAILRAFIEHEAGSPGRLVEEIAQYLGDVTDPDVQRALPAWLKRADAVLSNRMVLDGKVLSDEGAIALRAAILAVVVDDVQDLAAFLSAALPAGRQVVVAAAFLIGLRTGVRDLSWRKKLPYLDLLSPLLVAMHHPENTVRDEALQAFQEEPDETVHPIELVLYWRDRPLVRWTPHMPASATAVPLAESALGNHPQELREEPAGFLAEDVHARMVEGPDGRVIEVTTTDSTNQATSLRLVLGKDDRLRKQKEILAAACTQGICWRVGVTAEGVEALYADVQASVGDGVVEATIQGLSIALSLYLVPVKPKRRVRTTKAKVVTKDAS